MEDIIEYFQCDKCKGKDFKKIYNFSMRFRKVNFSDNLVYDKIVEEIYQCTNCLKRFSAKDIEKGLQEIKRIRKGLSKGV